MAGGVEGSHSGTFDLEDLPIDDGLLCFAGSMFVDGVVKVRVEAEKIKHTASVVTVPVCKKNMRKGNVAFSEN